VIHISSGFSAFVAAAVVGKRQGYNPNYVHKAGNIPYVMLGMGLLWFGWLGFNGGSAGTLLSFLSSIYLSPRFSILSSSPSPLSLTHLYPSLTSIPHSPLSLTHLYPSLTSIPPSPLSLPHLDPPPPRLIPPLSPSSPLSPFHHFSPLQLTPLHRSGQSHRSLSLSEHINCSRNSLHDVVDFGHDHQKTTFCYWCCYWRCGRPCGYHSCFWYGSFVPSFLSLCFAFFYVTLSTSLFTLEVSFFAFPFSRFLFILLFFTLYCRFFVFPFRVYFLFSLFSYLFSFSFSFSFSLSLSLFSLCLFFTFYFFSICVFLIYFIYRIRKSKFWYSFWSDTSISNLFFYET
jgi:Ammonium Transporter Family